MNQKSGHATGGRRVGGVAAAVCMDSDRGGGPAWPQELGRDPPRERSRERPMNLVDWH
jgi:hypothetical protein